MNYRMVLAFLLTAAAWGQQLGRIEGRVVSSTGEPVRKATVRLQGIPEVGPGERPLLGAYIEISGTDGTFVFPDLPPGRYQATANQAGFETGRMQGSVPLAAGQTLRDVDLTMEPLSVISGRVVDSDGDPVRHAHVTLLSQRWDFRGRTLQLTGSTTADDRGAFRVADLKPGRYYVRAESSADPVDASLLSARLGPNAQLAFLETYYPNEEDARRAQAVAVGPGQEAQGIEIRMRRGRLFTIRGQAVNALTSEGLTGAVLAWRAGSTVPSASVRTPVSTFRMQVPAGEYTLQFTGTDTSGKGFAGRLSTVVSGAAEGVVIRAMPNMRILGRVVVDGDADFEEVRQRPIVTPEGLQMVIPAISISLTAVGFTPQTRSGPVVEGGDFAVEDIEPGKYALVAPNIPGTYLKAVRVAGRNVPVNALLDLSGGDPGPVEIVLAQKPVQVTVTSSETDGQAVLWPKEPNLLLQFGGIVSVPRGNRVSAAPGEYYLAAFADADPEMLQSPAFLHMFNEAATEVSLKEGEQVTVESKVISKAAIDAALANLP